MSERLVEPMAIVRDYAGCEFRFNPATDSDLNPAAIPI